MNTDRLRAALADGLFQIDVSTRGLAAISYQAAADAVLALPAFRDLLAAATRDAEAVKRVRDAMVHIDNAREHAAAFSRPDEARAYDDAGKALRDALDGTP